MARVARFSRSLASGYILLGANIVYTVVSVPLAWHYLNAKEFGLWAVMAQITSHVALFDLGMSASAFRILVDYKDREKPGAYELYYSTSALIFMLQAIVIVAFGALSGPFLSAALRVPAEYNREFALLLFLSTCLLAVNFVFKIFHTALQAHQRYDIFNVVQSAQLLLMIFALWWSLKSGHGIYSGVIAGTICGSISLLAIAIGAIITGCAVPIADLRFPTKAAIKELLSFGSSTFLLSLGWQMVGASQILLVSRVLGIEAAGVWSVATKAFNMCQQLVWRPLDYSAAVFAEMFVRGERTLLHQRFVEIFSITLSMSAIAGALLVACNEPLLQVWAALSSEKGRISAQIAEWTTSNNILSAILLVSYTITRLLNSLPGITKRLQMLQYVYFLEGAIVILLGWFLAQHWGYSGVFIAAIAADLAVAGSYGFIFTSSFFGIRISTAVRWALPSAKVALMVTLAAGLLSIATASLSPFLQLLTRGIGISLIGMMLLWFITLSPGLRTMCRGYLNR